MTSRTIIILAIVLVVVGLIGLAVINLYSFQPGTGRSDRWQFPRQRDGFGTGDFRSNGEQIFLSGTSSRDVISFTGGPVWFQMHGGGCAFCHGVDGRGGTVTMMMGTLRAPDIRYKVLTGKISGEEEEEHPPFTDRSIKRAITEGVDPGGERLDSNMPRWDISERDLDDVVDFLKSLDP